MHLRGRNSGWSAGLLSAERAMIAPRLRDASLHGFATLWGTLFAVGSTVAPFPPRAANVEPHAAELLGRWVGGVGVIRRPII
jgi:hypothetical protein